jgi:hypothetical protein
MDEQTSEFRPPYSSSFSTFWSFVGELADGALPPKIDRSLMRSKSGTDQAGLTAAMKAFRLIDANQFVTGLNDLKPLDKAGRLKWLAEQINEHYAVQVQVAAQNGTEQQLRDSFREAFPTLESTETIRKAMTFFLHAARTANIPLSPHFPSTRSGSGAPGAPKPTRPARKRKPPAGDTKKPDLGAGSAGTSAHEHTIVDFGNAGTVSIDVDVKWLDLTPHQFAKLREFIKAIEALGDPGNDGSAEDAEVSP